MLNENVERSTSQAINDTGLTDMQGQSVRRGILNVVEDAKQSPLCVGSSFFDDDDEDSKISASDDEVKNINYIFIYCNN